jgi:hypothetical protein
MLTVRGEEKNGLYTASSGGLSGFSGGLSGFNEINLASTSPQSAHWKYWIASSRRVECSSMAETFTGLWHFGHGVSTNNLKDMVSPFRARRTEDTQKGPGSTNEDPGRFAVAPHQM